MSAAEQMEAFQSALREGLGERLHGGGGPGHP